MKLKILRNFTDKYTGEDHKTNDVISVDEARGKELLADSRKLVELIDESEKDKPKKGKSKEEK